MKKLNNVHVDTVTGHINGHCENCGAFISIGDKYAKKQALEWWTRNVEDINAEVDKWRKLKEKRDLMRQQSLELKQFETTQFEHIRRLRDVCESFLKATK